MRFRIFLLLGWLTAASLPVCAADDVFAPIDAALGQGRYQEAQRLAAAALAQPGLDMRAQSRLHAAHGLAAHGLGNNDEALIDFTQALSGTVLAPGERAAALFDRGVSLDSMGRLDDAMGDYTAALRLTPGAANALNNRANIYRREGKLKEARRDYLAALAGDALHAQYPCYGLGQIAEAQGDAAGARDFYAKAVAADPGYQPAVDRLQALGNAGDWVPADPGEIVLHPPAAAPPFILHPPRPAAQQAAAQMVALHAPSHPSPKTEAALPAQSPLRPAIIESRTLEGSQTLVQLGAWRSEAEAQAGWISAQRAAQGLLEGLTPRILQADLLGKGRYYRLRVLLRGNAPQFCNGLLAKGLDCLPVRD